MNLEELRRKLITAARANPPSDAVPYAFERRIMAQLARPPAPDWSAAWARALWRAAAPCTAIMLLLVVWSLADTQNAQPPGDLSQALDYTVLAAADQDSVHDSN